MNIQTLGDIILVLAKGRETVPSGGPENGTAADTAEAVIAAG